MSICAIGKYYIVTKHFEKLMYSNFGSKNLKCLKLSMCLTV